MHTQTRHLYSQTTAELDSRVHLDAVALMRKQN